MLQLEQINDTSQARSKFGRLGIGALFGNKNRPSPADIPLYCKHCQQRNIPSAAKCSACDQPADFQGAGEALEKMESAIEPKRASIKTGHLGRLPAKAKLWSDDLADDCQMVCAWETIDEDAVVEFPTGTLTKRARWLAVRKPWTSWQRS